MKGRERKRKKDNGKMEWETEKGRKEKVQREWRRDEDPDKADTNQLFNSIGNILTKIDSLRTR